MLTRTASCPQPRWAAIGPKIICSVQNIKKNRSIAFVHLWMGSSMTCSHGSRKEKTMRLVQKSCELAEATLGLDSHILTPPRPNPKADNGRLSPSTQPNQLLDAIYPIGTSHWSLERAKIFNRTGLADSPIGPTAHRRRGRRQECGESSFWKSSSKLPVW